MAIIKAAFNLF